MRVCVGVGVIIVIDGGRGKTGGVAVQGCGEQVYNLTYLYTFILHSYINTHMHTRTIQTHTPTHTHMNIYVYT